MEGTSGYNNSYKTAQDNLVKWAEAIDTTRPVTTGDNKLKGNGGGRDYAWSESARSRWSQRYELLSGLGKSSGKTHYDMIHEKYPEWCLYGSETASAVNSRGIYKGNGQSNRLWRL